GIVAHGCGKAQATVIDVNNVPEHGHVLGALVDHPRSFIFVKNQLQPVGPAALFGSKVGDIDNGGVDDAPLLDQQIPALALFLIGAGAAAEKRIRGHSPQADSNGGKGAEELGVAQREAIHESSSSN